MTTDTTPDKAQLAAQLLKAADEIAREGHAGWGNLMLDAAAALTSSPSAQSDAPDGFVIAPHFRGYAHLGIGAYLINHSAEGAPAELVITVATEEEKVGRVVGDDGPHQTGQLLQPEVMAVRLRFENAAGLDALEKQLRMLREVHLPSAPTTGEQA